MHEQMQKMMSARMIMGTREATMMVNTLIEIFNLGKIGEMGSPE
jgi:hypothetical protein